MCFCNRGNYIVISNNDTSVLTVKVILIKLFFSKTTNQTANKTEFLQSAYFKCIPLISSIPIHPLNTALFWKVDPWAQAMMTKQLLHVKEKKKKTSDNLKLDNL